MHKKVVFIILVFLVLFLIVVERRHYLENKKVEIINYDFEEFNYSISYWVDDDSKNYYFPTYMTDGYSLDNYSKNSFHKNLYFSNGNGTIFLLDQLTETSFVAQIDTEPESLEEMTKIANSIKKID